MVKLNTKKIKGLFTLNGTLAWVKVIIDAKVKGKNVLIYGTLEQRKLTENNMKEIFSQAFLENVKFLPYPTTNTVAVKVARGYTDSVFIILNQIKHTTSFHNNISVARTNELFLLLEKE